MATQIVMFSLGIMFGWGWMGSIGIVDFCLNLVSNLLFLPGVFELPIALPAAWTLSYEAAFYIISATVFVASKIWKNKMSVHHTSRASRALHHTPGSTHSACMYSALCRACRKTYRRVDKNATTTTVIVCKKYFYLLGPCARRGAGTPRALES